MARVFNQLSRDTRAQVRGPAGSSSLPGLHPLRSEDPLVRPAVPGDSGPCPRARSIDQLSQASQACARGPAVSTALLRARVSNSCPRRLALWSKGPGGQPTVPGDLEWCPRSRSVYQPSRATRVLVRGSAVNQLSQATLALVRRPTGSTWTPRRLGPMPKAPQGQPAVPGDSRLGPMARGFDQLSQATRV